MEGGKEQKQRAPAPQEIDELAQEHPRQSLLDALEQQLRDVQTYSRLLLVCNVDDKKINDVIVDFKEWIQQQPEVTGVLAIMGNTIGLHFLEGPTQKLYRAAEKFNTYTKAIGDEKATISNIRIVMMSELYTERASMCWCHFQYTAAKANAGALGNEAKDADRGFHAYKTILTAALKVRDQIVSRGQDIDFESFFEAAPTLFRNWGETLISMEDLNLITGKECDSFLDYLSFEELFIAPPKLQLESDLLWPMPPPPVY